jgi:hypothetical protein
VIDDDDDSTSSTLQTAQLLDSLTRLRQLVSADGAKGANGKSATNATTFATDEGAPCHESFLELRRLERSLDQYQSRTGQQLTYVGLLGHFSAGKSSTINALLHENTAENSERKTGQHPTDRAVTLITHPDNAQSLIGMHRRGEVEVGASLQDVALLREIVLVDTPGSGDPLIVEEMVRDFLPICDHLLYVFSAAVPLDTTDLPILQKAHRELPFIPMRFIITRADEFKIDHDVALTEENFDQQAADHFVGEFISRLEAAVTGLNVTRDDITMIDNRSRFRLEALQKSTTGNQLTSGSIDALHAHKLRYFATSADRLHAHFVDHLKGTLNAQEALLNAAKDNHCRYQKAVAMSHNRLTENWQLQSNQLGTLRATHRKELDALAFSTPIPKEMVQLPTTASAMSAASDLSITAATDRATTLGETLSQQWQQDFENGRAKLLEAVKSAEDPEAVALTIPAPDSTGAIASVFALPDDFSRSLVSIPSVITSELKSLQLETTARSEKLMQWVATDRLSGKASELLDHSQSQLAGMLDSFLESVDVYKAAVLSLNARELAQRAGVVLAIEELELVEIPETKRDSWLTTVGQRIFPNRQQLKEHAESESQVLRRALASIRVDAKFEASPDVAVDLEVASSATQPLADLVHRAGTEFQKQANTCLGKVVEQKDDALSLHKATLLETVARLGDEGIRVRRMFALSGAAVGVIAIVLASLVLPLFQPFSIFSVGIGIVLIGAGVFGGIQLAGKLDRSKRAINDSCDDYRRQAQSAILEVLDEVECPDSRPAASRVTDSARDLLHAHWQSLLTNVANETSAVHLPDYEALRTARAQFEDVRAKALAAGQDFYRNCEAFYEDIDGNLDQLATISAEIKEDAILPSFNLFEQRASELESLLTEIQSIHCTPRAPGSSTI